jgi:hypothetical protein
MALVTDEPLKMIQVSIGGEHGISTSANSKAKEENKKAFSQVLFMEFQGALTIKVDPGSMLARCRTLLLTLCSQSKSR